MKFPGKKPNIMKNANTLVSSIGNEPNDFFPEYDFEHKC